jgi:hypothetical protein
MILTPNLARTANNPYTGSWQPILGELLFPSLLEQVKNARDMETVKEVFTDYELIVDS